MLIPIIAMVLPNTKIVNGLNMADMGIGSLITFVGLLILLDKYQNIDFPYTTIREYITHTYSGGEEIYTMLLQRCNAEISDYRQKEKSFEDMFGSISFNQ